MLTVKGYKERNVFLLLYFICFCSLYLGLIEGFPLAEWLTRLKFVYILYGAVLFFQKGSKRINKAVAILFLVFLGYILAFSTVFVNNRVAGFTRAHCIMMLIYLAMLLITYAEVKRLRCFMPFVVTSFFSVFVFLLIASLTHLGDMVWNPLYVIKVLVFNLRVRSDFGISGTSNYTGAFCFVTLLLSFIYFYGIKRQGKKLLKDKLSLIILCADFYIYLMFGSSSSRSPLASMLVFLAVFLALRFKAFIKKIFPVFLALAVIVFAVLLATGFFEYVWSNSNREMNVTVNQKAFEQVGNLWIGMGYVDNGAFNTASGLPWGVYTSSLDMFYVYLFFSTGLIGTVWMGGILLALLILILRKRNRGYFPIMFSIYISLLFYAYWENIILTYRFWPFMALFGILFMFIDGSICDQAPSKTPSRIMRKSL